MTKTIISLSAFIIIFGLGFAYGNRKAVFSSLIASIFLIAICCQARMQAWYLMPLSFLIAICIPDISSKVLAVVMAMNLFIMHPNIKYQIISKLQQIDNVSQIDTIYSLISGYDEKYNSMGYKSYYFVETCTKMPFSVIFYFYEEGVDKKIIYISERARANREIQNIYKRAADNSDGYQIIEENLMSTGVSVILWHSE